MQNYYYSCLMDELGLSGGMGNQTYSPVTLSREEIISNHISVVNSFGVKTDEGDHNLPALYWTPKLHKTPYKQRFIAGSAKCSTKKLSQLLTTLLTTIKDGLHKYCETAYAHSGVNQMWILKNSKTLLENLKAQNLQTVTSIKTFDFSTLYTTIPHEKLKSRLSLLIRQAFFCKNGNRRYSYIVINKKLNNAYFVKEHSDSPTKYTAEQVINMLNFLIDNIFVEFGGRVFQQTVGIPMGTNCAPLLADLFLYSYEAEFIQNLFKQGQKKLAGSFNFTFRYIDDVLSLSNSEISNCLDRIYPNELEIKDTTETSTSASYLDLTLSIDTEGKLCTKLYDKRDDFDFTIVNFPYLDSNIPSSPAYGVFISQLIRYSRSCCKYEDFVSRSRLLTSKLMKQGYQQPRLKAALNKFYGRNHDLLDHYNVSVSHLSSQLFPDCV